jgi:hypothetical protein
LEVEPPAVLLVERFLLRKLLRAALLGRGWWC